MSSRCVFTLGGPMCRVPKDHPMLEHGCDKTFVCCRDRFKNERNFGGFPGYRRAIDHED